jgi:hypothetical protein
MMHIADSSLLYWKVWQSARNRDKRQMHQQQYCYVPIHSHIAGASNVMADDASRLWHLTDAELLALRAKYLIVF